jgi:hypothetical protein
MPIGLQRLQLPAAHRRRVPIALHQGGALSAGLLPQQESDSGRLPRLQGHDSGQGPAAVAVVVEFAAQAAPLHTRRIAIAPVGT